MAITYAKGTRGQRDVQIKGKFGVELVVTENGKNAPEYTVETDQKGELTFKDLLKYSKRALIIIAKQTLDEEQARGFDKEPILIVDNKKNKPVESVSPLGSIEFVSRANMKDIIKETFDAIIERSPIDTGLYISSHVVLVNRVQKAQGQNSLDAWLDTNPIFQDGDIIEFINTTPYARKLERYGVTGQRQRTRTTKSRDKLGRSGHGGRILAPNGAYYLASRAIKRKYGDNSNIKFTFISGLYLNLGGSFKAKKLKGGEASSAKPSRYLYPAISIRVSRGGIL